MPQNVIDLRKIETPKEPQKNPDQFEEKDPGPVLVEWTAKEYEARTYSQGGFLWKGALALAFILFGITTKNYFFIALVVLAFTVILMYERKVPREVKFSITDHGIQAGRRFFPYSNLKSFWIFDRYDRKEISLATDKLLFPHFIIPLGEVSAPQIRSILTRYLKEEEHQESFTDHLTRYLGF